jgi:hypothetical protein
METPRLPADAGWTSMPAAPDATTATTPPTMPDATTLPPPDAAPAPPDVYPFPPACRIVECSPQADCCGDWYAYVLDTPAKRSVSRPDLLTSLERSPTHVSGSFAFTEPEQEGVLGLKIRKQAPRAINVAFSFTGPASQMPYLGLGVENGASHCRYHFNAKGDADLTRPVDCYGPGYIPDRLLIRMRAKAAGRATLTVTKVTLVY